MAYINNLGQVRVGVRGWVAAQSGASVTDSDATAFVTAAGITDSTQISALNTLVTDLKTYGLWTKMKALYPFVGGSASSHKFNLKDPRDLDAAFRLIFAGGGIHSSTGWQTNGSNSTADTRLNTKNVLLPNNLSIGFYTNTDRAEDTTPSKIAYGNSDNRTTYIPLTQFYLRTNNGNLISDLGDYNYGRITGTNTKTSGFYVNTRASNNSMKLFKNNTLFGSNTTNNPTNTLPNSNLFIASFNDGGSVRVSYETINYQFFYVSDGLTDTEASNFYISVQKFQTTLGRQVGTPYVSDPDAIAFLMAAGITDGTQAAAINTLVIRMKADGVWNKMKAIYPFVGGSATSHKFNLKDPRDLDAAFRLVFNGGWTHTGTGAKPNGTTGYANTYLNPKNNLGVNSGLGVYSRTNDTSKNQADMGAMYYFPVQAFIIGSGTSLGIFMGSNSSDFISFADSDTRAFYQVYRTNSTTVKSLRNTTSYSNTNLPYSAPNLNVYIGARNEMGIAQDFGLREVAFAYMQENFTDVDALNLYTAVQAYQTTLGRQVNVPLVSDTDAQAFLNAANITSFQQASAVNKLVVDLKTAGVWTKMKAIYPFVGGSAASHKFNLKDPRDLDAAYRLVFNGGWTHASTGAKPNGSNGYADTFVVPKNVFNATTFNHVSYYSRTNSTLTTPPYRYDLGVDDYNSSGVYYGGLSMIIRRDTNATLYSSDYGTSATYRAANTTTSDSLGLFIGSQTGTNIKLYKNNSILASNTEASISTYNMLSPLATRSIWIGTMNELNYTTQNRWTDKESAFISIGDGLTDAEATSLYTAVQTYQTSLGRAVNTPIYNDGLVLNLDAGNANSYPGTGTTWFDLASGNNGTLVNGPTYDATNGGSVLFDGVNDNVDLGTGLNSTSLTISLWLNFNSTSNQAILNKGNFNNNQASYTISYYNNKIRFDTYASDTVYGTLASNFIPVLNTWYNIVYVANSDSSTYSIYINGIDRTTDLFDFGNNYKIPRTGSYLVKLGSNSDGALPFRGKISKVLIYQNVLSATEILNNFNSTRGRFGL